METRVERETILVDRDLHLERTGTVSATRTSQKRGNAGPNRLVSGSKSGGRSTRSHGSRQAESSVYCCNQHHRCWTSHSATGDLDLQRARRGCAWLSVSQRSLVPTVLHICQT